MKHLWVTWIMLTVLGHTAAAQAPEQGTQVTAAFLERRVPEELATEGVVLSRRNLALKLESVAGQWLLSLTDLATGRVAASTKVEVMPADREAAVATVTHVAAGLAAQIAGRAELPPDPPPAQPGPEAMASALQQAMRAERLAREEHDLAEATFQRRSLRWSAGAVVGYHTASGFVIGSTVRWGWYQGEDKLTASDFYRVVGHPELGSGARSRRKSLIGGFVAGGVITGAGVALLAYQSYDQAACEFGRTCSFDWQLPVVVAGVGLATLGLTTAYAVRTNRDSADDKSLADDYNRRLRRELGLPIVSRRSRLPDIALMPYVSARNSGLAVGARF